MVGWTGALPASSQLLPVPCRTPHKPGACHCERSKKRTILRISIQLSLTVHSTSIPNKALFLHRGSIFQICRLIFEDIQTEGSHCYSTTPLLRSIPSAATHPTLKSPLLCLLWQKSTISTTDKHRLTRRTSHTINMIIRRRRTARGRGLFR